MAYEVTAHEDAPSDRLVVSVGGHTLVYGDALDSDREAEGVYVVADADAPYEGDADLASELALLAERVPEVAAAVKVEYVAPPVDEELLAVETLEVVPVDPPDTVVPAGETSPGLERDVEVVSEPDLDDDGSEQ